MGRHTTAGSSPPAGGDIAKKHVPPRKAPTRVPKTRAYTRKSNEVEQLREKNFSLQVTVDDLSKQLAEAETEVRKEVVDTMGEQLQERKDWYEGRIVQLQKQVAVLLETACILQDICGESCQWRMVLKIERRTDVRCHRALSNSK